VLPCIPLSCYFWCSYYLWAKGTSCAGLYAFDITL
jgi:hypothetical protein